MKIWEIRKLLDTFIAYSYVGQEVNCLWQCYLLYYYKQIGIFHTAHGDIVSTVFVPYLMLLIKLLEQINSIKTLIRWVINRREKNKETPID